MSDFEVNEGPIEAAGRRLDQGVPGMPEDQSSAHPEHPLEIRLPWADLHLPWADLQPAAHERPLEEIAEGPAGAGAGALQRKLPEETPVVRRLRQRPRGHLAPVTDRPARRVAVDLIARRRAGARRACPCGWQVRVLSIPPRNRRRLWTTCH